MQRLRTALATMILVSFVASCGSDSNDGDGSLQSVEVGTIPIASALVPLVIGIEKGYFEDEGLEIDYHLSQGGAALVPAVVSGQYDIAFANNVSLIVARAQGLELQIVSAANSAGQDPDPIEEALVVPADSPIQALSDLEGKTIAVNTLNNIVQLANMHTLDQAGVDPDTVEFVEVGFPDMPLVFQEGRADAADIADPFKTVAMNDGATILARPFREVQQDLYISSWFATDDYIESDPETAEAFGRALDRAKAYATEHPAETRGMLPELLEIDPNLSQQVAFGPVPEGEPSEESMQALYDLVVKYGVIDAADLPDVTVLLPDF